MVAAEVRVLALALVLLALVASRVTAAGDDPLPDAQLLLDLDLLSQAEPHARDLMRRMSVVERLRLLEVFKVLDARPAAPAEPRAPAETGTR
jgi:hypothetical protein